MAYCSRRDRFRYEPAMVRYCDTEATKKLNCLSPSTSANEICVPPNRSPPLVTPTFSGGRPSRNIFSNVPFFFWFACTSVWVSGAWKSMIGPGSPKSREATVALASFGISVCRPYSPL